MCRFLMLISLQMLAVTALTNSVSAQASWGSSGCGPVGPSTLLPTNPLGQPAYQPRIVEYPRYTWKAVPGDDTQLALFEYGRQLGNYDCETGKFCVLLPGDVWVDARMPGGVTPPSVRKKRDCVASCCCGKCEDGCQCGAGPACSNSCPCVQSARKKVGDLPLTGVVPEKIRHGQTRYCGPHGLQTITLSQAYQALLGEGKTLTDDSKLMHLTCIGTSDECQPVLDDLANHDALSAFKSKLLVQAYRPDQGRVRDAGFKTDGHPSIYLQASDGTVLHRQDGYRGAAKLAEAIRRADPNYDPSKDPDLNKPAPKPAPQPQPQPEPNTNSLPWYVYGALGLLALIALKK